MKKHKPITKDQKIVKRPIPSVIKSSQLFLELFLLKKNIKYTTEIKMGILIRFLNFLFIDSDINIEYVIAIIE
jgi:hypothetical protein